MCTEDKNASLNLFLAAYFTNEAALKDAHLSTEYIEIHNIFKESGLLSTFFLGALNVYILRVQIKRVLFVSI